MKSYDLVFGLRCPECSDPLIGRYAGSRFAKDSTKIEPDTGPANGKVIMRAWCRECEEPYAVWICQSPVDVVLFKGDVS